MIDPKEILMKHLNDKATYRQQKFNNVVDHSKYIAAMEDYNHRTFRLFFKYMNEVKSHLTCNCSEDELDQFVTFTYSNEHVFLNMPYFFNCFKRNTSAYIALELLHQDYDEPITVKEYHSQIIQDILDQITPEEQARVDREMINLSLSSSDQPPVS